VPLTGGTHCSTYHAPALFPHPNRSHHPPSPAASAKSRARAPSPWRG
jgi:hypothetical protein